LGHRPASSLQRIFGWGLSYTILIVDDNTLGRHSVRASIEQNTDWRVCGEAENGKVAVEKVRALRPDVVILDLQMPVMNGLEAAREIRLLAPNTAMIMFTMHSCEQLVKEARAAGIRDVVSKSSGITEHLFASVRNLRGRP
jgi:two-component system, NarL family, response regulator NreC